ncbi:MAG: HlyD family efflux transporter periplasmic adaptor subunit [Ilumatobacter sp.]|nr:HlyD family efflux transporter periplasmic adaptor subunit [Ilumatobacter sp.]MDG1697183.1 HlyD family efflux transporter periplasmic adaptor subunit [Ilumatobacter sp.]
MNANETISARQNKQNTELEGILKTTSPRGWWAVGFVTIALTAVATWACVVSVPQTTKTAGVTNALVYSYQVTAPTSGKLLIIDIHDAKVKENSEIGSITDSDGKLTKVISNKAGQVRALNAAQNQYLQLGDPILSVAVPAPADKPVEIITFVGASDAPFFPVGGKVDIQATDTQSGRRITTTATIIAVGQVPSTSETLDDVNGGVTGLTESWMKKSSGLPFPVFLETDDWPTGENGFNPFGGLIVEVTRTYDTVKPVERLFGGR